MPKKNQSPYYLRTFGPDDAPWYEIWDADEDMPISKEETGEAIVFKGKNGKKNAEEKLSSLEAV
jgi:hypothetical protein